MTKELPIPETVGEFIELLSKYPKESKFSVSIAEVYDNGSIYPTDSYRMSVDDYTGMVYITFADGRRLPN